MRRMREKSPKRSSDFVSACSRCSDVLDGTKISCSSSRHSRQIRLSNDGASSDTVINVARPIDDCISNIEAESDQVAVANFWLSLIPTYILSVTEFLDARTSSRLDPSEVRGFLSEAYIYTLLSNSDLFPWISEVELHAHNSTMDGEGIDISLQLNDQFSAWIDNDIVKIQVKSRHKGIYKYLNKLNKRENLTEQEGMERLKQENILVLNAAAGEIDDREIIGVFLSQLYQLVLFHSGKDAAQQFLDTLSTSHPKSYALLDAEVHSQTFFKYERLFSEESLERLRFELIVRR